MAQLGMAHIGGKVVWKRRESESNSSTEESLRAILNKLAPSDRLGSLATQVANHLLEDDGAGEQLADQLVERSQLEPLFAATYAKLCALLVRVRSGFVFYKHLVTKTRASFSAGVQQLIVNRDNVGLDVVVTRSCGLTSADIRRHRLAALVVFLCQLYLEDILSLDQLQLDYLSLLESHLPDDVAVECLCKALSTAGANMERQRPQWVRRCLLELQESQQEIPERSLRMTFMVKDLVELHERNWQPRDMYARVRLISEESEP